MIDRSGSLMDRPQTDAEGRSLKAGTATTANREWPVIADSIVSLFYHVASQLSILAATFRRPRTVLTLQKSAVSDLSRCVATG
jgi:hypothetical protein